jgi:hypothetical protein
MEGEMDLISYIREQLGDDPQAEEILKEIQGWCDLEDTQEE